MPDLTPMTRQEKFLNGDTDLEPITRREHFYAGREGELPEGSQDPQTREEWFIKKYRGGGGGDITVESLSVTSNGTYTAPSGKAYSPVEVNVPLPQNAYLKKSAESYPITPSQLPLPKAEVAFSGDKAELYVGSEPIVVTEDNAPYLYRQSPSGKSCVDLSLVGGTIAWNQLVQSTDTSCTVPNNHKYIFHHGTTYDVAISDGNAFTVDGSANDNVHDLTQAFGSTIADAIYTMEQATAGSGIAWLKSYGFLTKDYYAYDSGSLQSVNVASRKVVGKNLFGGIEFANKVKDACPAAGQIDYENKTVRYTYGTGNKTTIYDMFKPNTAYTFLLKIADCGGQNFSMRIVYTDGSNTPIEVNTGDINKYVSITTNPNKSVAKLALMWYQSTIVKLKYDECGIFEGTITAQEYEPYKTKSNPLDSNLTLRGIVKKDANNNLYYDGDIYESDGTITRNYEERAYQSGDESLTDAITDGTTTVVKKSTPTTESAQPYTNPQLVGSTEEFIDAGTSASTPTRDVAIPVGQDSKYVNGDIYISYGTSPIDMAKEHSIVPYATTYIDSNGTEDVEYWDNIGIRRNSL